MDTYTQAVSAKRQYRSPEEKRRIVQEALGEGASVARVVRAHGVNANLVFNWWPFSHRMLHPETSNLNQLPKLEIVHIRVGASR